MPTARRGLRAAPRAAMACGATAIRSSGWFPAAGRAIPRRCCPAARSSDAGVRHPVTGPAHCGRRGRPVRRGEEANAMHSTMNFIYAGFWTLVLAAWLIPHKRLVPMIEAKFARAGIQHRPQEDLVDHPPRRRRPAHGPRVRKLPERRELAEDRAHRRKPHRRMSRAAGPTRASSTAWLLRDAKLYEIGAGASKVRRVLFNRIRPI